MPSTALTVPREVSNRTCRSRTSSNGTLAAACEVCSVRVPIQGFGVFRRILVRLRLRLYLMGRPAANRNMRCDDRTIASPEPDFSALRKGGAMADYGR